jgi:hypothetical protein
MDITSELSGAIRTTCSKSASTDGTRTVCVDEMTGLQALERVAPDKPPQPDSVAKHEFEY